MGLVMSESEIRIACARAGGTCHTETGCTCEAANTRPVTDWVQGPSQFGAHDNPFNEPEQSMLPPTWLAKLLLGAVALIAIGSAVIPTIWSARP